MRKNQKKNPKKNLLKKSLMKKNLLKKNPLKKSLMKKNLMKKSLMKKSLMKKSLMKKSLEKNLLKKNPRKNKVKILELNLPNNSLMRVQKKIPVQVIRNLKVLQITNKLKKQHPQIKRKMRSQLVLIQVPQKKEIFRLIQRVTTQLQIPIHQR